jgi:hypothetical protein
MPSRTGGATIFGAVGPFFGIVRCVKPVGAAELACQYRFTGWATAGSVTLGSAEPNGTIPLATSV